MMHVCGYKEADSRNQAAGDSQAVSLTDSPAIRQAALAIASIPVQPWETLYDPEKALKQGTAFPCLDLPFFKTGGESLG